MVVFTCNNCGESVHKPRVAKHISYECNKRNAPVSLCCIDCLKDFDSYSHANHTKCLTELQRYSGSNFVPKPSSNKGERKQNSWINVVRSVLDQPSLDRNQRELLQAISHLENVPRKKAKFQNFIKSSFRHLRTSPHVIDSVFELLEQDFKRSTASTVNEAGKRDSCPKEDNIAEAGDDDKTEEKCGTLEKKRKRKHEQLNENEDDKTDGLAKEKKKKKKKKEENAVETIENGISNAIEDENCKKKKMGICGDAVQDENSLPTDNDNDSKAVKKKQKKKKKEKFGGAKENDECDPEETGFHLDQDLCNQEENEKVLNNHENLENISKEEDTPNGKDIVEDNNKQEFTKKKKKKSKFETTDVSAENEAKSNKKLVINTESNDPEMVTDQNGVEPESVSETDHQNSENGSEATSTFSWKTVITSILLESKNRELSLKKMKKKVAKKYLEFHEDDKSFEEIIKKFEKRVKKIANVEFSDERIRLLE